MNTIYNTKISEYSPSKDLHFVLGHTALHFPKECFEEVSIVKPLQKASYQSYQQYPNYRSYRYRFR